MKRTIIPNTDNRIKLYQVVNDDPDEKDTICLPVVGWSIDTASKDSKDPKLFLAVPIAAGGVYWSWFLSIPQGDGQFIYLSKDDDSGDYCWFNTFDQALKHCCQAGERLRK